MTLPKVDKSNQSVGAIFYNHLQIFLRKEEIYLMLPTYLD